MVMKILKKMSQHSGYWQIVWKQFCKHRLGVAALFIVWLFVLIGIYAPFLASSKPLVVCFQGQWYFPLFRYLFYPGFYSKQLDIFYNLLMFTFPLFILVWIGLRRFKPARHLFLSGLTALQFCLFFFLVFFPPHDPAASPLLNQRREKEFANFKEEKITPLFAPPILPNWQKELSDLSPYAKLNLLLSYHEAKTQQQHLQVYEKEYEREAKREGQSRPVFPTLWNYAVREVKSKEKREREVLDELKNRYPQAKSLMTLLKENCRPTKTSPLSLLPPWIICDFLNKLPPQEKASLLEAKKIVDRYEKAEAEIQYLHDREDWLKQQSAQLQFDVMPLIRPFHWEDDAGGDQILNRLVPWWELTRINRKDLVAALIFGVRISLSVGLLAIGLALLIGIPIGAFAGYYGGKWDLFAYRLIEVWESMPIFFMLLMIVAFLQSKSIFLIIAVIGFFGWTGFSRFVRGEFFRQKQLLYVEACHAMGYPDRTIIFSHLLPNAIPPLLTLVPFAIMGAISSEAGLSFLGLGEEGSNSWGVLMDEGRSAFPAESYLLWPPAMMLTILLVAIALVGDSLRDALDPKLHVH